MNEAGTSKWKASHVEKKSLMILQQKNSPTHSPTGKDHSTTHEGEWQKQQLLPKPLHPPNEEQHSERKPDRDHKNHKNYKI